MTNVETWADYSQKYIIYEQLMQNLPLLQINENISNKKPF